MLLTKSQPGRTKINGAEGKNGVLIVEMKSNVAPSLIREVIRTDDACHDGLERAIAPETSKSDSVEVGWNTVCEAYMA